MASEYADETAQALRVLGGLLKHWRGLRGWTQAELAVRVRVSAEFLASVEQGRRRPREPFFSRADEALGASGSIKVVEPFVRQVVKRPAIPSEVAEAERGAVYLSYFDAMVIPAVMQTEAYARATFVGFAPVMEEARLDALIADRLKRAAVFDREPLPRIAIVIEESALRRPVGGRAVLQDQLVRVAEIAERRNVAVQVLPMDSEDHAGLTGSTLLMETDQQEQVAYVEHAGGAVWIDSPREMSLQQQRYGTLRAQALSTRDSLALIEKLTADGSR